MRVFDASSMIHAWDSYPLEQFPGLWQWIAQQVAQQEIRLPVVAFEEVTHKTPECATWLREQGHEATQIDNDALQEAARMKHLIGVIGDKYHPNGVDENDLLIIATAFLWGQELVSDEARQPTIPQNLARQKIPAVCALPTVKVNCVSFLEFIKQSGRIFR